ncbi:hypothetical protein QL285_028071 [Trifolium repens]|nr:hypothetical protein QL285_028071 [Trifolium repens]
MASISSCIIDIEKSIPDKFAKDQRPYKFDDLTFAIENPVDFESLRVNGFPEVKTRFERQSMMYYFDMLNGPTYGEVIKEFWMKASVITKSKYLERMVEMARKKPELIGKTPAEMSLKPFVSTEIESYVAGFRIAFKEDHINEALKLSDGDLVIKSTDSVTEDVDDFIFKPKENPGDKTEWKDLSKVIYRILINSIITKLGGTDQISTIQKLFTFHVGKGNFVDIGKLIFNHLAESITASKPIIRHGRLLSHMFAQCGLMDAIKPFFPGYGTYPISSKIINSTTLRYLQLLKGKKVVHPTHPLLLRESEENIDECRLIHVSDRDARRIAEAHAGFLKSLGADVGTGESKDLTVRQARILAQPTKIIAKRKPVKSPAVAESKKVAKTKKNTGPRTTRKRKLVLPEATDEDKEEALKNDDIAQVEALKQKEETLKDGYDCGIDPKVFDDMYSKLPPRNIPDDVLAQQTMYGSADGKYSTFIGNSSAFRDYFRRLQHPSEIPVKRAFDRIFKGVNYKKDLTLSKNQPSSEIDKECEFMEVGLQNMIRAIRVSYKKELEFRNELARLKAEQEKREAEERERKRLEDERLENERLEALAREQARLAEEARFAAEQARLENLARNAPEFALLMRDDQEKLKEKVDVHAGLLASILETLKSINERLSPLPPPQP